MMFWSIGPFAVIVPFIMIFIAIRAIRNLTSYRREERVDHDDHDYESIAVDVKRLKKDSGAWMRTDTIQAKIFRLALRQKGVVTVSDVVIDTGLCVSDAEKMLEEMVDGIRVKMEVTEDGMVQYEFPEIIKRFPDEQ